eukprot:331546_1
MLQDLKFTIIIIFSFYYYVVYTTDHHHCQHNKIQSHHHDIVPISFTDYYNHPYDIQTTSNRRLTESSSESQTYPIRIVVDTEQLKTDLTNKNPQLIQHAKQLISAAIDKLQSMIEILSPVQGNLRLHRKCKLFLKDKRDGSKLGCLTYE